jgi:5,10-methylenetetrahydromethanopterin reductase
MKFTFDRPTAGRKDSTAQLVELAQHVERAGFDRHGVSDWKFFQDCFVVMTACLQATTTLQVESLVTEPYVRNPAVTAAAMATMDDLSGGRAIFGIGAGVESSSRVWTSPWGHARPHPLAAVREAVELSRRMWGGDEVTVHGQVAHVEQAKLSFETRPAIPVCIAARSPRMLALAGEIADIVHVASFYLSVPWQREILGHVRAGAERARRQLGSFEIDMTVPCSVSRDRDAARDSAKRLAAQGLTWMTATDEYALKGWQRPADLQVPESLERKLKGWNFRAQPVPPDDIKEAIPDDILDRFTVAGTPEECAERLRALHRALPDVTGFRLYLVPAGRNTTVPYPFQSYLELLEACGDVLRATKRRDRVSP